MQQSGTPAPVVHYSILGKLFHWGFVAIFAYGIYKQVDNISQLADGALWRFGVIFAALFLILLGARFFYMSRVQSSALPENTHAVQKAWGQGGTLRDVCVDGVDCGLWPNHRRALHAFGARGSVDQCGCLYPRNICYGQLLVDRLAYHSRPLSSISARWSLERDSPHFARMISHQTEPYALCASAGT